MTKKEIIVFILNDNNQILLQKRSANKKYHPNKLTVLSGHVEESDNSFIDAAIREIKEELSIDILKEDLIKCGEKEKYLDETCKHITYFYYIKINKKENEFVIQTEELSEVKWYDIDKVIDMIIKKDSNLVFTDKILKLLKELKVWLYN